MTSGKYFNKGVKALDSPHIGHVIRETPDKIIVFGGGDDRYDIPKSDIQQVGANVLIGLPLYEIVKKYKVSRQEPLPTGKPTQDPWTQPENIDLATYEKKYPKSLFNKGVRTKDEEHVGHIMKETDDKIVVFGHYDYRFDFPKSKIIAAGRNVILDMDYPEIFVYKVDRNALLPTGQPIEKLNEEKYPEEDYPGFKEYHGTTTTSDLDYSQEDKQTPDKPITNMIMGDNDNNDNNYSKNTSSIRGLEEVVDAETLVAQTQDRMWRALEGHYRYDSSLKDSQGYLLNHVNSKISLVVMYADLVGSTNMSMTLPVDKMATIIRAFSYEMTSTVRSYGGYVLKYVGDEGENVIVQYGHDKSSLIDILGYSMSICSKITSLTNPNKITIGEDVYDILHPEIKSKFTDVKYDLGNWKYTDRQTGQLYKLYTIQD
jgi:hypothetical protein